MVQLPLLKKYCNSNVPENCLIHIRLQIFNIFLGRRYDVTLGFGVAKDTLTLNWLKSYRKIGKLCTPRLTLLILNLVLIFLVAVLLVLIFLVAVHLVLIFLVVILLVLIFLAAAGCSCFWNIGQASLLLPQRPQLLLWHLSVRLLSCPPLVKFWLTVQITKNLQSLEDIQVESISQKYTFGKYTFEKYALRFTLFT